MTTIYNKKEESNIYSTKFNIIRVMFTILGVTNCDMRILPGEVVTLLWVASSATHWLIAILFQRLQ